MAFTYFEWAGAAGANISRTGDTTLSFFASPASESIASAVVTVYDATTPAQLYRTTVLANGTAQDGGAYIRKAGGLAYQYYLTVVGRVALDPHVTSGQSVIIGLSLTASGGGTTREIGVIETVYDPPALTITSPTAGEVVDALPLGITWDATDATGISYQHVSINKDGETVWSIEPSSDVRAALISAADNVIENDAAYTIELWALNGVGINHYVQVSFTTHWAAPPLPVVTVETDTESMAVTVTVTAGEGEPATDHLIVARVNQDGTRWVIADNVESGESVTDPLPPMGVEYSYAVTAVTEAGTTSVATVAHTVESTAWALNFGPDGSESLVMRYGQRLTRNPSHGGELYHFADGGSGDGYPVYYPTTDNDESLQLEFVAMTIAEADRLIRLAREHRTCWLRDQYGHRWLGVITPSVEERTWGVAFKVTANVDVARFREAW